MNLRCVSRDGWPHAPAQSLKDVGVGVDDHAYLLLGARGSTVSGRHTQAVCSDGSSRGGSVVVRTSASLLYARVWSTCSFSHCCRVVTAAIGVQYSRDAINHVHRERSIQVRSHNTHAHSAAAEVANGIMHRSTSPNANSTLVIGAALLCSTPRMADHSRRHRQSGFAFARPPRKYCRPWRVIALALAR